MSQAQMFIHQFFHAILHKQADDIGSCYWPGPETYVILEGPRLATLGYEQIAVGWGDFCQSAIVLDGITWTEGPLEYDFADCTTLAGVLRLWGGIPGRADFDNTFRATFLLRKTPDGLSILHEHVSGALPDPYGIGDWKKQEAS